MKKLIFLASGLAFSAAVIAHVTNQGWLASGFLGFIGAVFLIVGIVDSEN